MGFFLLVLGGVLGAILTWLYFDSIRSGKGQGIISTARAGGSSASPDAEIARLQQQVSECGAARQSLESEIQGLRRVREENEALTREIEALRADGAHSNGADDLPQLVEPMAGEPDDLTAIKGIGKVLDGKLKKLGFTTFKQIAELTPDQQSRVDEVLNFRGRIEREEWVEQAQSLVAQKSG